MSRGRGKRTPRPRRGGRERLSASNMVDRREGTWVGPPLRLGTGVPARVRGTVSVVQGESRNPAPYRGSGRHDGAAGAFGGNDGGARRVALLGCRLGGGGPGEGGWGEKVQEARRRPRGSHPHPSPLPLRERGKRDPAPRRGGRERAVGQQHRLPAGGHVGPPLRPYRRYGWARLGAGERLSASNMATLTWVPRIEYGAGSARERRWGIFRARYSVVWSGWGLSRAVSGRGVVESMGPAQGSGSCQCASSFSLILRSAMVSSAGAGFSSFSSSMRSDARAFLRMAALAFPSRRRCVRVRRVRGRRAGRVFSFEFLVSSWEPGSGSRGWVPASAGTTGEWAQGTTEAFARSLEGQARYEPGSWLRTRGSAPTTWESPPHPYGAGFSRE